MISNATMREVKHSHHSGLMQRQRHHKSFLMIMRREIFSTRSAELSLKSMKTSLLSQKTTTLPLVMIMMSSIMLCIIFAPGSSGNPDAKRLYDDLISRYNKLVRPVMNVSEPLTVHIKLKLSQLIEVNLKNQIMTTNLWVEQYWHDYKLTWDPKEYGGVDMLHVPSDHIWRPDIVLYNNADGNFEVTLATKAILNARGFIQWKPPAIYKSSCEIDVEYFPFDEQTCIMKFGSWTYDGFQVDLRHRDEVENTKEVELGIDLTEFYLSVEWDILEVPAIRNEKFYTCCVEPYIDITFNISMRRKTLFYTVNLIIPCMGISFLTVLVFYLPSDSGEKVALSVSILVSLTVFFLLLAEIIPSTSLVVPLLGKYLLFTMILVTLSICVSVVVLNVHFRSPATHKMAPWVRRVFIHILPRMLLMKRPPYSGNPSEISQQTRDASDYRHRPHHHSSPLYFPPPDAIEVDIPEGKTDSSGKKTSSGVAPEAPSLHRRTITSSSARSHSHMNHMTSGAQVHPHSIDKEVLIDAPFTTPSPCSSPCHRQQSQQSSAQQQHLKMGSSRESLRDIKNSVKQHSLMCEKSHSLGSHHSHHSHRHYHHRSTSSSSPPPPPPPPSCRLHGRQVREEFSCCSSSYSPTRLPPLPPPPLGSRNIHEELENDTRCCQEVHMIVRENLARSDLNNSSPTSFNHQHNNNPLNSCNNAATCEGDSPCCECGVPPPPYKPVRRIHFCPEFLRAMENVQFIADHTRKSEEDVDVKEDWKYVAMVLDRLFLWIFTVAVFVGTCGIILHAPTLYDNREPIDIKLSEVAMSILNSRRQD